MCTWSRLAPLWRSRPISGCCGWWAGPAGTYAFVNPVVAVLLGWAFAGEVLNFQMLSGAGLIVLAVVLVVLGGRRKTKAATAVPEVATRA